MKIRVPVLSRWLERRRERRIIAQKELLERLERRRREQRLAKEERERNQAEEERERRARQAEEYAIKARMPRYAVHGGAIDVAMQAREERLRKNREGGPFEPGF
jgi:hypothetical protein